MSFFQVNKNEGALQDANSGGSYITTSGMYDVIIDFISVKVNSAGARHLDFNVLYNGTPTTIYGLKLDTNNGQEHFQRALFNKLCVILGIDSVDDPVIHSKVVGKDKKIQDFSVLEQFSEMPITMRLKYSYNLVNGKIYENRDIIEFYNTDNKATAKELTTNANIGDNYNKNLKYAADVKYNDGLTAEDVEAWKKSLKDGTTPATPTQSIKPAGNIFNK